MAVVIGLALRLYLDRPAEDRLDPGEAVSVAELRQPLARPSFLACPPGYCTAADMTSPVFDMPWDQLREYWKEMIAETPTVLVVSEFEHRRAVYIQHSPIFRFPDIITVEFVALAPERSSVAIYSRSRYGGYDFAKNRKRVERWLFLLQEVAHSAASSHGRWH
jgi:uncharacterized protein (DUF1499 family)